jgi:hypothetical protein
MGFLYLLRCVIGNGIGCLNPELLRHTENDVRDEVNGEVKPELGVV